MSETAAQVVPPSTNTESEPPEPIVVLSAPALATFQPNTFS